MTLNPIKALSEALEKLIIEHGSAVVQEKHIALLREQLAVLDKQFSLLSSENESLKSDNETLKSQNKTFIVENEILRKKIEKYEQPHAIPRDDTKISILKFLFKQNKLPTEQIAQALGYEIQVATFHLQELKINNMVSCAPSHFRNEPPSWKWSLTQEGQRYVIENKLIS